MFKWICLALVAWVVLTGRSMEEIYRDDPDVRTFKQEVYDEPEFLSDCLEYKMEICFEGRKRAKF